MSSGKDRFGQRPLILFSILLLGTAALSPATAAEDLYHIIQKGETVYSVSRKYDVTPEALMAANGIADPSKLKTGQKLLIPSTHRVAKGETLFGIARSYGLSLEVLLAANRLAPGAVIKPGDILVIPGKGRPEGKGEAAEATGAKTAAPAPAQIQSGPAQAPKPQAAPLPTQAVKAEPTSSEAPKGTLSPPTLRISEKSTDKRLSWPCPGEAYYLDGKLFGVIIKSRAGETAKAVASGTVVSAGPYRGFGQVVFVQARTGHIYVYGGNENLAVSVGEAVRAGQHIGRVGIDAAEGAPMAYFFVFKGGEAVDPAVAPRD
jgi:LysM repeat protein